MCVLYVYIDVLLCLYVYIYNMFLKWDKQICKCRQSHEIEMVVNDGWVWLKTLQMGRVVDGAEVVRHKCFF